MMIQHKNKKSSRKVSDFSRGILAIAEYSKRFRAEMIWIGVFGLIIGVFEGLIPYVLGRFFDVLINPTVLNVGAFSFDAWMVWILLFLFLQLCSNVINWKNGIHARILWEKIFADYLMIAFENILRKTNSFHAKSGAGKNWETLDRARFWMANILGGEIPTLAPEFLSVFVGLVVCFLISPLLGSILVLGIVIYVLLGVQLVPEIAKSNKKENRVFVKVWRDMYDTVANVFEVKRYGTEDYEIKKNKKLFKTGLSVMDRLIRLTQSMSIRQNVVITLTRVVVFTASVFLIQQQSITVGELIALNGYSGLLFGPFIRFLNTMTNAIEGIIKIADAEKILSLPIEKYHGDKLLQPEIIGELEFQNIKFAYDASDGLVLNEVSFKVSRGSVTALVGKSGSGKSTLVDLIGGFYFPQKGKVLIDGLSTRKIDLKHLRSHIAYVSQEVTLFNDTVAKNIAYGAGRKVTQADIEQAAKSAHCHEFIMDFKKGYRQIVGERGVKLSVGQKQRIAIARAILRNPTILILDEPTSALDSESERFITKSLETLMKGRTTFIVAHRLSTVRNADQILVMDKGCVIEQGSHQELMDMPDGRYRDLYEMHIGLH